jgi:hypothetical protein
MDHMRGVAGQRDALGNEGARNEQPERIGAPRGARRNLSQVQAKTAFQLGVKLIVRQRDDTRGLGISFGPHQRGAIAFQRQDRERTSGEEMLLGAPVVRALVRNRGDDRGLTVVPAMYCDVGLLAHARVRAVSRDQQRGETAILTQRYRDARRFVRESRHRHRAQLDPCARRLCGKRRSERRVLDHVGKRLTRFDLARQM